LNLSPDHLDRHASFAEYGAAKARIFANQTENDWAVINADDPQTLALARGARARTIRLSVEDSIDEGIVVRGGAIREVRTGHDMPLIPLSSIRLIGRHLLTDVMAATAVARLAGVAGEAMVQAVESFSGLEHALEPVAVINGIRFVNDSKATNIEAATRAIESFPAGLVAIIGGRFKGGDFRLLREPLQSRQATVVAIGEAAALVRDALDGFVPVHTASDLAAAVRHSYALAQPGNTVVLAPACASFDMFRDYAERGDTFKQEVRKLAEEISKTREQ
jgi:UDP-N-acetylmuramoylalanine--D-glutamate ligase